MKAAGRVALVVLIVLTATAVGFALSRALQSPATGRVPAIDLDDVRRDDPPAPPPSSVPPPTNDPADDADDDPDDDADDADD